MDTARTLTALCAALTLSACATPDGAFPSLARRDAERVSGTIAAPLAQPDLPATATVNPAMARRLDQLEDQAKAGHAKFHARESRARQLTRAARGAAVGSESWAVATVAIAELEAARSEVMIALADLDSLYTAQLVAGQGGDAVGAVRNRVTELVAQEDAVLAELGNALRI